MSKDTDLKSLVYPRHMHKPGPAEESRIVQNVADAEAAVADGFEVEFCRDRDGLTPSQKTAANVADAADAAERQTAADSAARAAVAQAKVAADAGAARQAANPNADDGAAVKRGTTMPDTRNPNPDDVPAQGKGDKTDRGGKGNRF